jgi:hypothetical protein
MANQQLIRGARMAADKFTDVGDVVGEAVMRGEQAILRRRAVENRRQELQAQAIAQLPMLDESQVPEQMREYAMSEAMNIRNEAIAAIQDKNITPVERQLAISKAMGKVNKIATQAGDFKQWVANLAEMGQDDLSKLNSPELMNRVDDIYKGNYVVQDGQFIFNDGEVKDFSSLVNTRPISRRSDSYLQQLQTVGNQYEKYGLQGWDEASFNNKIENEVKNIKYSDADLASILVDEMGDELPEGMLQKIKDDFEDNGVLDSEDESVSREGLVTLVSDRYKSAAKEAFDRSKKLYDDKVSAKAAADAAKDRADSGMTASLRQEIQLFGPTVMPYSKFSETISNIKYIQGPPQNVGVDAPTTIPVSDEMKSQTIVGQLRSINKQSQGDYVTRKEQLKIFIENAKATESLEDLSPGQLKDMFNTVNGDALAFYKGQPLQINYNNPDDIYDLILKNTPGLSPEGQKYFFNKYMADKYANVDTSGMP